jgi:type I restriction enzyme S subunit
MSTLIKTAKNIKKGFIDYECSKEYVPEANYAEVMSKGMPKVGDILFTTEAPLGNIAQVDNANIALAQRVIKLRAKPNIANSYLLHYMLGPVYQRLITRKAIGSTVLGISGKELHQTHIHFPTLPEQQKIASFLSAVDEKIQQLTRKKELLEQYKKGVMQQLFSGKLRFKDLKGKAFPKWEEKRLGDIGEFKNGLNKDKSDFGFGSPFVNLMDVFGKRELNNQQFDLVNSNDSEKELYSMQKGDVLFIRSSVKRSGVGEAVVVNEDLPQTVYSGFLIRFRDNRKTLDQKFKKYCFANHSFRKELLSYATTSANTNINQESLGFVQLYVPVVEEHRRALCHLEVHPAEALR